MAPAGASRGQAGGDQPRSAGGETGPGLHSEGGPPATAGGGAMKPREAERRRVVIDAVSPTLDGGRFPIKRTVGELVSVEADAFADGHDVVSCALQHCADADSIWHETAMRPLGNDRWHGAFEVTCCGTYRYRVCAWIDHFLSWRRDLIKRIAADQDISIALATGAALIADAAGRAPAGAAAELAGWASRVGGQDAIEVRTAAALDEGLLRLMARYPNPALRSRSQPELTVIVDRARARFSTWYEVFPRSTSPEPGRHGTLRDCERWIPYIADMGFDVLYLPPIHPIGLTSRKGPNNTLESKPSDPGSPWAIGSPAGGHTAVHPELGTLDDFRRLLAAAGRRGIEIALDIAFQCSPDHPWVQEHPEWFVQRPDGTIQYAENPPKRYQDIYPLSFESADWPALWDALRDVFLFWLEQGVRVFRVDNPHTKSLYFWEWVIAEVKARDPEVIFLSEAFTRPAVMHRLAKAGFSQSYSYFTWRNTKWELTQYLTELTSGPAREYFRPNLWPNTPDILPEYLQLGGRPAFAVRLILAATLGANYGIYGPAFELCERRAQEPGSEEYLHGEKYEVKHWDLDRPDSLRDLIARINRVRRENPALQQDWGLRFHSVDNEQLIAYSKEDERTGNRVLVVVNLDPWHRQSGWVEVPLEELGMEPHRSYQMHDLIGGDRYLWGGRHGYVELDPAKVPGKLFRMRRRQRTERDFDYYL